MGSRIGKRAYTRPRLCRTKGIVKRVANRAKDARKAAPAATGATRHLEDRVLVDGIRMVVFE